MQFRDLKSQYRALKPQMDEAIQAVLDSSDYIAGDQVEELEKELAEYVGVKNCVSCGNGTDALVLALKAWGIGAGDAVFVPDHTFFGCGRDHPSFPGKEREGICLPSEPVQPGSAGDQKGSGSWALRKTVPWFDPCTVEPERRLLQPGSLERKMGI